MLLTRSPLSPRMQAPLDPVRLACVKHAASVHPEPGSNSPTKTKNIGSSQKTIQQKQTPTIKKQNVPKSSASKKQKTEKNQNTHQNQQAPQFNPTQTKQKKHTIENTNNQTTNQPNWPVRIRREQKISGGKVFLPPASALGNEYKVTALDAWRQTKMPKSKGSHKNLLTIRHLPA